MSTTKPTVARLYLAASDAAAASRIASNLGESQSWLLSRIVIEGLRVIQENGGTLRLPLRFQVGDGVESPPVVTAKKWVGRDSNPGPTA